MASESAELMHRQYMAPPKGSLWAAKRIAKLIYGEQILWEQLRKVYGRQNATNGVVMSRNRCLQTSSGPVTNGFHYTLRPMGQRVQGPDRIVSEAVF